MSPRRAKPSLIGCGAVAIIVALVGCGSHVDTDLPDVAGTSVLVDTEIQSTVDSTQWGRYLILIGDDSATAEETMRRIRARLEDDGWRTRHPHHPAGTVDAVSSDPDDINFGPARGSQMPAYVPRRITKLAATTAGAERRKVLVAIR